MLSAEWFVPPADAQMHCTCFGRLTFNFFTAVMMPSLRPCGCARAVEGEESAQANRRRD